MMPELELWPLNSCEHCGVQEPGPLLWFLNHGICRWNAAERVGMSPLVPGSGREAALEEHIDLASTVAPDERSGVPIQADLVGAFGADQRIVVAQRYLSFGEHDVTVSAVAS